jgi:hypothetical protein
MANQLDTFRKSDYKADIKNCLEEIKTINLKDKLIYQNIKDKIIQIKKNLLYCSNIEMLEQVKKNMNKTTDIIMFVGFNHMDHLKQLIYNQWKDKLSET